jgi:flagellar FliJ protein
LLTLPKFRFSLETLLRHRENLEQKARDELLRLIYNYQVELGRRDELRARFQETMKELLLKRAENGTGEELQWFYLYLNRLTQEIQQSTEKLDQLETEVKAQRTVVIEASKKRKILDLMKERKERQFAFALEKQEQKEIDELVVTRFGREPTYQGSAEVQQKQPNQEKDRE